MQRENDGGNHKKSPIKAPVRQVSSKTPARSQVRPPVKTKTTAPSKQNPARATLMTVKPSGFTPRDATRAVNDQYGGNVQRAWHDYSPGAIKEYMKQGLPFAQARAQAQEDFGFTNDPDVMSGPRLYSNYWWQPDYTTEPTTSTGGGYTPKRYYGGGGGGGGGGYNPPPPVPPEMKIRTTAGIRRSPYWQSEDPYQQEFEPRFVVLGNQQAW